MFYVLSLDRQYAEVNKRNWSAWGRSVFRPFHRQEWGAYEKETPRYQHHNILVYRGGKP